MTSSRTYTVRPFSKPQRSDLKDAFRAFLSPGTLLLNKLHSGDLCQLETETASIPAQAWSAHEKIQDNIVQTSKSLQDLHGLRLGDKVSIRRDEAPLGEVQVVLVSEILHENEKKTISIDDHKGSEWSLKFPLRRAELICPGMVLNNIEIGDQKRSFKVEQVNSSGSPDRLFRFVSHSQIRLQEAQEDIEFSLSSDASNLSVEITREGIGGLAPQIEKLNKCLSHYGSVDKGLEPVSYKNFCRGGVLLYGPSGTGKTLILRKVARARWRKVFYMSTKTLAQYGGKTVTAMGKIFEEALQHQPSVVILDNFESLTGDHDFSDAAKASSLCQEFDQIDGTRVFFIAATTNLNVINERLRRVGYFSFEIEIPLPDSMARAEILKIESHLPQDAVEKLLDSVASRTPSYSGADLNKLVQCAIDKAEDRALASQPSSKADPESLILSNCKQIDLHRRTPNIVYKVEEVDYYNAQAEVRPTTMQAITLEMPKVYWSDIGGQDETKEILIQALELPFTRASEMQMTGIKPKKSLLLYGPPGCSKTLTAKAAATEFSLNFIGVKGPELLNMYVGESERMLREVFQRARAARPSIIFFDEIDAIGASRDALGNGSQSGVHTLSTLLNEMDGIEELHGVFVLAATNKPDILDPALTRSGRLTEMLYIGPPDLEARMQILEIYVRRMRVAEDVDLDWLAKETEGFSGAEIAEMCQKAGWAMLKMTEVGQSVPIEMKHFEMAKAKMKPNITPEMKKKYEEFSRKWKA